MLLYAYNRFSNSGKDLAQAMGIRRIKHNSLTFKGHPRKNVINWGASSLPEEVGKCNVINSAEAVALASNKLRFFQHLDSYNVGKEDGDSISIPTFTTDITVAQAMYDAGVGVVERHKLTGNSGDGIVIRSRKDETEPYIGLGLAPLYTAYIPKKEEYRVHVCNGQVVDTQRKARVTSVPDSEVDWKVRNLAGGFIFARNENHTVPASVMSNAVASVLACGLDFGAVDVVWNEKAQQAYVLEVNTAPGLTGTTLSRYVEVFNER